MGKQYNRKYKEDKPVIALCYDFDKTLSPDDMQAQGYIQSVGYDIKEFWKQSNSLAENNDMDQNLAYMYKMVQEAEGNFIFNKAKLEEYGSKVKLFPGVEEWFKRIRKYGESKGVIVEHYVISSGLKEMIEGTSMAKNGDFTKIYASSFYYNERGVAKWPAQVINYTNKTQFLFRIEKGVLDINDLGVNEYFEADKIRVPFRNMIYIGDSDTDIPCMKLVNAYGGYAIGVYNPENVDKTKVYKMVRDKRIKMFAPANYEDGSELDDLVKMIIDRTATNEKLEQKNFDYKKEVFTYDLQRGNDAEKREKEELIIKLEMSNTFTYTHQVVEELLKYNDWTQDEKIELFRIAVENNQVNWILHDSDVLNFYKKLLVDVNIDNKYVVLVKELIR